MSTQPHYLNLADFFTCLQHQYIGVSWLAAPMYWFFIRVIIRVSYLLPLTAHCLFGKPWHINSAGESGNKTMFLSRWRLNIHHHVLSQYLTFATFLTPLFSNLSQPLKHPSLFAKRSFHSICAQGFSRNLPSSLL